MTEIPRKIDLMNVYVEDKNREMATGFVGAIEELSDFGEADLNGFVDQAARVLTAVDIMLFDQELGARYATSNACAVDGQSRHILVLGEKVDGKIQKDIFWMTDEQIAEYSGGSS